MRSAIPLLTRAAMGCSLLTLGLAVRAAADEPTAKTQKTPDTPTVNLLEAARAGQVTVEAEGTGDGRMTLSVTNRTDKPLRVVLPPGLVASGATGQFGGMGGMGGMGGGMMGGMGGMGGMGMGGGMMGGMGGMGGGMMGGGMGGMGGGMMGGGMMGGMQTMPPQMGMMMLGMLIMHLVGDRDSWDYSSMMMGGMGGMGMGGMGGGMMGGMGGMGGMMGGGMRSVPPTSLPHATLRPGQTRSLPTRLVSLDRPGAGSSRVALPEKGEPLLVGDIAQLTDNPQVQLALKRLAAEKAPETVAQLVLWRVSAGLDWSTIRQLSQKWANPQELALARKFVDNLDNNADISVTADSARMYWDVVTQEDELKPLAKDLQAVLKDGAVLGLKVESGVPARPKGPSLACRVRLSGAGEKTEAIVTLSATDGTGSAWTDMGKFTLPLVKGKSGQLKADEIADAAAEGILGRLVRAQLTKGPKAKGKETYRVRIDNASPLVLNGLALAGNTVTSEKDRKAAALAGLCVPPRRSLTITATPDVVERLGLKTGIKAVAADLSGL